jgi:hypothetical protein
MEPCDYYDAPINKVLHYSRCKIDKGLNKKGEAQQIIEGRSARAGRAHPLCMHSFIHSFIQGFHSLVLMGITNANYEFTFY